ncbi:NifU family protein [Haloplanus salinarum]|uniref:NifU family protein n=1 Tax=Haloplanus salinarum TaxID=1912324 RepID=UPI00214B7483|nr:NifU family protein [Haloplanus salinarum]
MSTRTSARSLERRTRNYLNNNVPQIQEHGGHFEIEDVDHESGAVTVAIGGACSGCGIAPMTMKAIKRRIADEISSVTVRRAGGPRAAVMPDKTEEMERMEEYEDYSPPF